MEATKFPVPKPLRLPKSATISDSDFNQVGNNSGNLATLSSYNVGQSKYNTENNSTDVTKQTD